MSAAQKPGLCASEPRPTRRRGFFIAMFPFGPTVEQVQEAHKAQFINHLMLVMALEEKGVLTAEDVEKCRVRATHVVDQVLAQVRDAHCNE